MLNKRSRLGFLVITVLGGLAAAWIFTSIFKGLLLLFAGILLGIFLTELATRLSRKLSCSYRMVYLGIVICLLSLMIGSLYFMGSAIGEQVEKLVEMLHQASDRFEDQLEANSFRHWLDYFDQQAPNATKAISAVTTTAFTAVTAVGSMLLVMLLGGYFGLQPERYRQGILVLFAKPDRPRADRFLSRLTERLWFWCLGRLVGMAVIGVGSAVGLWLLGIPLPVTLGVLAGLLNFLPNIGPLLALAPPALLAFEQGSTTVIYVVIFYCFLQFIEGSFLTPLIDQHQVSLPPGLILASQLLLGIVGGFLGLLLATPLTVVGAALVEELVVEENPEEIADATSS